MKNCTDCKHAQWKLTAAGKLHPSGDGRCTFEYKPAPLPACMYFIGHHSGSPKPSGGAINRRHGLTEHCVCFARSE